MAKDLNSDGDSFSGAATETSGSDGHPLISKATPAGRTLSEATLYVALARTRLRAQEEAEAAGEQTPAVSQSNAVSGRVLVEPDSLFAPVLQPAHHPAHKYLKSQATPAGAPLTQADVDAALERTRARAKPPFKPYEFV